MLRIKKVDLFTYYFGKVHRVHIRIFQCMHINLQNTIYLVTIIRF